MVRFLGVSWSSYLQENEEARDKAGDEEEQFQLEHGRWQRWADTTAAAYQALAAAAEDLTRRNKALVDSSKASMIAEGIPEVLVHSMPGAFVPKDEGLEAQEDSLRCMESFRDVSLLLDTYASAALCILAVSCLACTAG